MGQALSRREVGIPIKSVKCEMTECRGRKWIARSSRAMTVRQGFSILELVVVVVVIAVLAAIAFPKYNKAVEETHKREAKTALSLIRSAELAYKIDNNEYYAVNSLADSGVDKDTADEARSILNIDIYNNDDWEYTVGVINKDTATATATRARGEHEGDQILLDVTGGAVSEYSW